MGFPAHGHDCAIAGLYGKTVVPRPADSPEAAVPAEMTRCCCTKSPDDEPSGVVKCPESENLSQNAENALRHYTDTGRASKEALCQNRPAWKMGRRPPAGQRQKPFVRRHPCDGLNVHVLGLYGKPNMPSCCFISVSNSQLEV